MMAANFGQKLLSVWNQLICQSQYWLKQKVLCVFIAIYGVNNQWKIRDTWPPRGFKDVDHGKKQKAKMNHFRKTAFIYQL